MPVVVEYQPLAAIGDLAMGAGRARAQAQEAQWQEQENADQARNAAANARAFMGNGGGGGRQAREGNGQSMQVSPNGAATVTSPNGASVYYGADAPGNPAGTTYRVPQQTMQGNDLSAGDTFDEAPEGSRQADYNAQQAADPRQAAMPSPMGGQVLRVTPQQKNQLQALEATGATGDAFNEGLRRIMGIQEPLVPVTDNAGNTFHLTPQQAAQFSQKQQAQQLTAQQEADRRARNQQLAQKAQQDAEVKMATLKQAEEKAGNADAQKAISEITKAETGKADADLKIAQTKQAQATTAVKDAQLRYDIADLEISKAPDAKSRAEAQRARDAANTVVQTATQAAQKAEDDLNLAHRARDLAADKAILRVQEWQQKNPAAASPAATAPAASQPAKPDLTMFAEKDRPKVQTWNDKLPKGVTIKSIMRDHEGNPHPYQIQGADGKAYSLMEVDQMTDYLKKAGGDINKARELALKDGRVAPADVGLGGL
jgi:hypothetical protein